MSCWWQHQWLRRWHVLKRRPNTLSATTRPSAKRVYMAASARRGSVRPEMASATVLLAALLAAASGAAGLSVDTAHFGLQEYRAFLTANWDVIKALDASTPDLRMQRAPDEPSRTELRFSTGDEFRYHWLPAASGSARLRVRAPHDAHLAFAPEPYELDPIVELFLGTDNNTLSAFSANRTSPQRAVATPGLLHPRIWRSFRLQWGPAGVSAWRDREPRPFLAWAPPPGLDSPPVLYLGVRTGYGAKGDWVIEDLSVGAEHVQRYKGESSPAEVSSVHFKVRTANDAHVGLTTSAAKPISGPMIEIVIGGWGNKKSVIRRGAPDLSDRVAVEMPDLLNASEPRGFWVRWGREVAVGREGEACPFMSWTDPEPFHAAYLGVHTGFGASGDWKIEDWPELHTPDSTEYKFTPFVPLRALSDALDLPQW